MAGSTSNDFVDPSMKVTGMEGDNRFLTAWDLNNQDKLKIKKTNERNTKQTTTNSGAFFQEAKR